MAEGFMDNGLRYLYNVRASCVPSARVLQCSIDQRGFKPSVPSEGFFLTMRFVASIPHEAKRAQSRSANS